MIAQKRVIQVWHERDGYLAALQLRDRRERQPEEVIPEALKAWVPGVRVNDNVVRRPAMA